MDLNDVVRTAGHETFELVIRSAERAAVAAVEAHPEHGVPTRAWGWARVRVRPGTSRFARWLKQTGRGSPCNRGGVTLWHGVGSYTLSVVYARAAAAVLCAYGVNATVESDLD